jgi:hypothetical protein
MDNRLFTALREVMVNTESKQEATRVHYRNYEFLW